MLDDIEEYENIILLMKLILIDYNVPSPAPVSYREVQHDIGELELKLREQRVLTVKKVAEKIKEQVVEKIGKSQAFVYPARKDGKVVTDFGLDVKRELESTLVGMHNTDIHSPEIGFYLKGRYKIFESEDYLILTYDLHDLNQSRGNEIVDSGEAEFYAPYKDYAHRSIWTRKAEGRDIIFKMENLAIAIKVKFGKEIGKSKVFIHPARKDGEVTDFGLAVQEELDTVLGDMSSGDPEASDHDFVLKGRYKILKGGRGSLILTYILHNVKSEESPYTKVYVSPSLYNEYDHDPVKGKKAPGGALWTSKFGKQKRRPSRVDKPKPAVDKPKPGPAKVDEPKPKPRPARVDEPKSDFLPMWFTAGIASIDLNGTGNIRGEETGAGIFNRSMSFGVGLVFTGVMSGSYSIIEDDPTAENYSVIDDRAVDVGWGLDFLWASALGENKRLLTGVGFHYFSFCDHENTPCEHSSHKRRTVGSLTFGLLKSYKEKGFSIGLQLHLLPGVGYGFRFLLSDAFGE